MNETGEQDWISNEKYWSVVSNQIPVTYKKKESVLESVRDMDFLVRFLNVSKNYETHRSKAILAIFTALK